MTKIRPFLKWAGGKYHCIDEILNHLPTGTRLIEPFGGSGTVLLNAQFDAYLLGESNADLIYLFNNVQKKGIEFIDQCQYYFQPQFNQKEKYYELRAEFNQLTDPEHRASLFLYLNRHGYNGLCRYNSKGLYNVPFGLYAKPYFPRNEMMYFHQKSQNVDFVHHDFRTTFALAKPGDVIYCDPPYVPIIEKSLPFSYTRNRFTLDDQIELAQLAEKAAARGIPVMISNHDTDFTRKHYHNAEIKSFLVSRFINCQGNLRQPVRELVAIFK